MSTRLCDRLQLRSQLQPSRFSVRYADGTVKRAAGEVEVPLSLLADAQPYDCGSVRFTVVELQPRFDLVLGTPFGQQHRPRVDWSLMTIMLPYRRASNKREVWRRCHRSTPADGSAPETAASTLSTVARGDRMREVSLSYIEFLQRQQDLDWGICIRLKPTSGDGTTADLGATSTARSGSPPESGLPTPESELPRAEPDPETERARALAAKVALDFADVLAAKLPTFTPALAKQIGLEHRIELKDGAQPYQRPLRRASTAERDELLKQLTEYLNSGRVVPSTSPWGTNVLFVKKKDGSLRFCVDYRGLNDLTVKNSYALPHTEELFDRLQGARYFSKIDLLSGFFQIPTSPEDRAKTAFRTQFGHFEWTVLPMGLTNAPATFQHLMNSTFFEFLHRCVLVFLDDIVVYSRTLEEHERDVRAVLQKLRERGLCAKASKCELFKTEIEFLGHRVGRDGLRVMADKVEAVRQWPTPRNAKDVRSFLGLAGYYRRFVHHFSQIAAPLHDLTKTADSATTKAPPFEWQPKHQQAFDTLKAALQSAPVLVLGDPDRKYVVTTDASDFATGAVLEQDHGHGLQPVAYCSHKLTDPETRYATHDKEMLSIIRALDEWRPYLQGRLPFRIRTDHRSLRHFMTQQTLNSRQVRWLSTLADFEFEIEYVKGKENNFADALSRRPDLQPAASVRTFDGPRELERLAAVPIVEPEHQLSSVELHSHALRTVESSGSALLTCDQFERLPVFDCCALARRRSHCCAAVEQRSRRSFVREVRCQRATRQDMLPEYAEGYRDVYRFEATTTHDPSPYRPAPNAHGTIVTESQRCTATTKSRQHCRQRTARGQYCWSHLRTIEGLRLQPSRIPGAGIGLFAAADLPAGRRILYTGDLIPLAQEEQGGPYVLQIDRTHGIDAARANTGEGRWVNAPAGTRLRSNCEFAVHDGKACLVTKHALPAGTELLVGYSAGYWSSHRARLRREAEAAAAAAQPRAALNALTRSGTRARAAPSAAAAATVTVATDSDPAHTARAAAPVTVATDSDLAHTVRAAAEADADYQARLTAPRSGERAHAGLLYRRDDNRLVIPRSDAVRCRLISLAHDPIVSGHTGVRATLDRLRRRVYWSGMDRDVDLYVRTCDACQRFKAEQQRPAGLLQPMPIPPRTGHTVNLDFVTDLPRTAAGYTAYLSMSCALSNVVQIGLCTKEVTAQEAARLFFDHWVRYYGLPEVIVSDRDPRFDKSQFWRALMQLCGVDHRMSTAAHAQTNGRAENRQRSLHMRLRPYVDFDQRDWDQQLRCAVLCLNTTTSVSTGMQPFEVLLGYPAHLPLDIALAPLTSDQAAPTDVREAHVFVARQLGAAWNRAREALLKAQQAQKKFADRHRRELTFKVGDLVLLSTHGLKLLDVEDGERKAKLSARFVGPFPIKSVRNDNAYELTLPAGLRIHPVVNVSRLRPYHRSPATFAQRPSPVVHPPPVAVDPANGDEEYEVERILGRRETQRGRTRAPLVEYLVKWKGYDFESSQWIPASDMRSPDLIAQFEATNAEMASDSAAESIEALPSASRSESADPDFDFGDPLLLRAIGTIGS